MDIGSRVTGSDEASPTTTSGSAQLNALPEFGTAPTSWGAEVWKPTNTSPNTVSPTNTKNNHSYYERNHNPSPFLRQSMSNGSSSRQSRTMAPAPIESPTSSRYTAVVGGSTGDDRGLYGAPGPSQLGVGVSEMNRRHSTDHSLPVGHNRPGAFSSRQPETNLASITTQFGDSMAYPYPNETHTRSQRPSISGASVSLAPETTRAQPVIFSNDGMQTDLSEHFGRAMNFGQRDSAGSPNGYMSNGYNGPVNQPFQPGSTSRPWHQFSNGTRNLGRGTQQDAWPDSSHTPYSNAKRGSIERVSPAGSSNQSNFAGPRNMSGTPNPRPDPWNRSAPRAHHIPQDLDRRQDGPQYSQMAEIYPPFNNSPYSDIISSYDTFAHNPNYRASMPPAPYGTQINMMGPSLRPSGVRDVIPGTRSALLDQFRSVNKSNKRFELHVGANLIRMI